MTAHALLRHRPRVQIPRIPIHLLFYNPFQAIGSMQARITRYKESDRKQVKALIVNVWGRRWLAGVLHAFDNCDSFVVKLDGNVAGGMTLDWGTYMCLLDELIVDSTYRRHGIGTMLLGYAIQYAKRKKLKFVEDWVDTRNKPALTLYRKYGFRKYGSVSNLFERNDSYVHMCKSLR